MSITIRGGGLSDVTLGETSFGWILMTTATVFTENLSKLPIQPSRNSQTHHPRLPSRPFCSVSIFHHFAINFQPFYFSFHPHSDSDERIIEKADEFSCCTLALHRREGILGGEK